MPSDGQTTIRRVGPGDEAVLRQLATRAPRTELLADERTLFLVAFDAETPVGFVFGYELPRRHGDWSILFVYELSVDEDYRRRGIAKALMIAIRRLAESHGVGTGFVLTEPDNEAANAVYASLGGTRSDTVQWDFSAEV